MLIRSLTRGAIAVLALAAATTAQAEAAADLSPEALARAVECKDGDAYRAIGESIWSPQQPKWLKSSDRPGQPLGYMEYRVEAPLTVFGRPVDHVGFLTNWVVIELPRDEALAVVKAQAMERLPIRIGEQYYRFVDDDHGPMMGVFELSNDALLALFAPKAPREQAKTLFVGCNYGPVSKAEFLEAASHADAASDKAAADVKSMIEDMAKSKAKSKP